MRDFPHPLSLSCRAGDGGHTNTICGVNDGLHMYVDAGRGSGAANVVLSHTFVGASLDRTYRIKVSQIECSQTWSPPQDCTQYFTGASGNIKTYNFDGGQHLVNQIVK